MGIDLNQWQLVKSSRIDGEFQGFDSDMIFCLQDGTYWHQTLYKYRYHYAYNPPVKIYSKFLKKILLIDSVNDYVEVEEVRGVKSRIVSAFSGFTSNAIFELQNGQVWKQDEFKYSYFYAYRPEVVVVNLGYKNIMIVNGRTVQVKRIS